MSKVNRVDHVTTGVVNARLKDLNHIFSTAITLPLIKDVKGLDGASDKLGKHVAKKIGAKSTDLRDMQTAKSEVENKAATYLTLDNFIDKLDSVGASKTELAGLVKFRNKMEKEVFKALSITDELLEQVRNGEE